MRHRRKQWQTDILEKDWPFYFKNPSLLSGQWNDNHYEAVHVEIGSGKGQYIVEMAKLYPNKLFIGIEMMPLIGSYILKKLSVENLNNVRIIIDNADNIKEWFEAGEIDVIHLNFSDPWPKKSHAKRRLTYPTYLNVYKHLLKNHGQIHQKTDNIGFFEYSVEQLSQNKFVCLDFSADFRRNDHPEDAETEYEERFMGFNQPIYRAVWSYSHD
ncbi:MAG TPA: tRNA (guanosine(46)-N7)-methyltransferase TrmB [Erysipelothrix sp.]|nr:tRNA (guanosine(46)-N7)-methyltransferase TrmB [Erysipelothrix sp.]